MSTREVDNEDVAESDMVVIGLRVRDAERTTFEVRHKGPEDER